MSAIRNTVFLLDSAPRVWSSSVTIAPTCSLEMSSTPITSDANLGLACGIPVTLQAGRNDAHNNIEAFTSMGGISSLSFSFFFNLYVLGDFTCMYVSVPHVCGTRPTPSFYSCSTNQFPHSDQTIPMNPGNKKGNCNPYSLAWRDRQAGAQPVTLEYTSPACEETWDL